LLYVAVRLAFDSADVNVNAYRTRGQLGCPRIGCRSSLLRLVSPVIARRRCHQHRSGLRSSRTLILNYRRRRPLCTAVIRLESLARTHVTATVLAE